MDKPKNNQARRLVRLFKADEAGLPVAKNTLYQWRHRGRYPEIFVEVGRAVCVDLDAFDQVFQAGGNGRRGKG